jgi:TPR repeat protein
VPGEKPALTPAPSGTPELLLELDMPQLLAGVSAGTGARLDSALIAGVWGLPTMDVGRPIAIAKSDATSAPMLLATGVAAGARYELAPVDAELAARGLKALKGGSCALREGGPGPVILCGERAALLALGSSLAPSPGPLLGDTMLRITLGLGRSLGSELYEWREAVPRNLDPLLPARSLLDATPGLRLAVLDVGFEVVHRIVEGYEALGPVQLSVGRPQNGKFSMTATLAPLANSIALRSIESARPARVPAAFWDLSEATESAVFFDAGLLAPFSELSPRALGLFAKAAGGGFVGQLSALPSACLQAGQAVVLASGHKAAATSKASRPWPPEVPAMGPPPSPALPSFTLLGVEDAKGACAKALVLALDGYERQALVAGQTEEQRYLSSIPHEKPLPKGVRLVRVGWGKEPSYLGIGQRQGALWLELSSDLGLLKESLTELLAPAAKRKSLKARTELAGLAKAPTLISGFVREDSLPFSSAWQQAQASRFGATPAAEQKKDIALVPFAIVRDGPALRISGDIDVGLVRRSFAKTIAAAWSNPELQRLGGARYDNGLRLLEAACQLGEGSACNWLGVTYGDGRGVPKDVERALPLLERGCQQGFGMACANVAFYRKPGIAEELRLFKRACEQDSPIGCAWWGVRLLDQNEPGNQRLAFEKLQVGCDSYVGWACARIGSHYREGVGLAQNDERGADFEQRACDLSFGTGCAALAEAYIDGKGRPKDSVRGMQLLQKACKVDKAEGCYALGLAYLEGHGTAKDEAAARDRLSTACDAEHAEACRALAEMAGEP